MNSDLIKKANTKLDDFDKKSSRLIDKIVNKSKEFSSYKSQVLVGIMGGAISIPASSIIAHFTFLSFPIISGSLLVIGIASGILGARGRKSFQIEKRQNEMHQILESNLKANRTAYDEIMDRIRKLPKDAPPEVRDGLYDQIKFLNGSKSTIPLLPPSGVDIPKRLSTGNENEDASSRNS